MGKITPTKIGDQEFVLYKEFDFDCCDDDPKKRWRVNRGKLDGYGIQIIVETRPFALVLGFGRWWIALERY